MFREDNRTEDAFGDRCGEVTLLVVVNLTDGVLKLGPRLLLLRLNFLVTARLVAFETVHVGVRQGEPVEVAHGWVCRGRDRILKLEGAHVVCQPVLVPLVDPLLELLHGLTSRTDVEDHEEDE